MTNQFALTDDRLGIEMVAKRFKIESELTLLKWMVGVNIGLTLAIVSKLFLA